MKNLLYRLFENSYLDRDEARDVLIRMAHGQYNDSQIAAFITVEALQDIILRQVRSNQKVKDCKCELVPGEGSAAVRVYISFAPDAVIPELTTEIQTTVKENVEKMTGVAIEEIQMVVEKAMQVSAIDRPRVG